MNTFYEDIRHIDELIAARKRRLHDLELQQATKGSNTPSETKSEIQDINKIIEDLYKKKSDLLKKAGAVNHQEKRYINKDVSSDHSQPEENTLVNAILDSNCVLFLGSILSRSSSHENLPFHILLKRNLAIRAQLCDCEYLGGKEECVGLMCCCHWSLQKLILYCSSISSEILADLVEETYHIEYLFSFVSG